MKLSQIPLLRTYFRQPQHGFTLMELMVASFVSLAVLSAALGAISAQRKSYLGDRDRINTNNNLNTVMSLIGDDLKQAGERLEQQSEFPVIKVVDGTPSNQPDSIIIQRKLQALSLTICQTVSGGATTIEVADAGDSPPCQGAVSRPMNTSTGDIYNNSTALANSDSANKTLGNLTAWRKDRCIQNNTSSCDAPPGTCAQLGGTNTECMWAYLYDPNPLKSPSQRGEWLLISGESEGACSGDLSKYCWRIHKANSAAWQYTYTPTVSKVTQPRLYVLEQKEYRLSAPDTNGFRVLELIVNGNTTSPKRITNQMGDLQIRVNEAPVTDVNSLSDANDPEAPNAFNNTLRLNASNPYYNWQKISGIEVKLKGVNLSENSTLSNNQLTLQSEFYPRNAASVLPTNN